MLGCLQDRVDDHLQSHVVFGSVGTQHCESGVAEVLFAEEGLEVVGRVGHGLVSLRC